jgi:hypothetical protein
VVTPAHVHETFRKIAGVDSNEIARRFRFDVPALDLLA